MTNLGWKTAIHRFARPHAKPFIFIDPPYPLDVRVAKSGYGKLKMTHKDHIELLDYILGLPYQVMICSYHNDLYDDKLRDWHTREFDVVCHSSVKKVRRLECVWMNYDEKGSLP